MQTKKRAKSVRFGKDTKKVESKTEKETTSTVASANVPTKEAVEPTVEEVKEERKEQEPVSEEAEKEAPEEKVSDEKPEDDESVQAIAEPIDMTEEEKKAQFGSFTNSFNERTRKKGNVGFFINIFLVTFLLALFGMAVFYYTPDKIKSDLSNSLGHLKIATPTDTPTATSTPTPKKLDLSAYTIRVLNGSETTGEAAKVKELLTEAGFTTGSVGNADTNDFTKTVIAAKKDVSQEYLDELIKTLQKNYEINTKIDVLSATSGESDVIVTIGSSQAQ